MSVSPTVNNTLGESDKSLVLWKWVLLTATPDGVPVQFPEWADVTWTFGASGDAFGGSTVSVEGSNDGVTFFAVKNAAGGAAITATSISGATSIENPLYQRPNLTVVGVGATMTVYALVRRAQPLRT